MQFNESIFSIVKGVSSVPVNSADIYLYNDVSDERFKYVNYLGEVKTLATTDEISISSQGSNGGTGEPKFQIDENDTSSGYFTDKIKEGANVTFTEQVSAGAKTIYINSTLEANGIYGSQEIPVNDENIRVTYDQPISGSGTPIISLVTPLSGDFLFISSIYNSNETGFNVMLSSPVRNPGYMVNWTLNTSQQFDLSSMGQSIIPSVDDTYDLGSPDKKWRSLYVSENTIYIGSESISVVDSISGGESQISFSGNEIAVFNQDGALPLTAIPAEIQSGLSFQDMIDPNATQLPNVSGYGIGNFFIASDTGTLTDNISASFSVSEGDWAINEGTTWKKMPFKLPVRGITSVQIKEGAIQSDNIFAGAVTEAKIGTGAVTVDKIDPTAFNLTNFTTTEMDINKVLRPDGGGGFSFGNVNLDVDAVSDRVTTLEGQTLDSRVNVIEGQTLDSRLTTVESNKLDTSVYTALSGKGGSQKYVETIGNSSDNPITVTHNLGTRHVTYSILNTSTYALIDAEVSVPTINTMRLEFSTPPISGQYDVTIIG
jgi:hypothetical protein